MSFWAKLFGGGQPAKGEPRRSPGDGVIRVRNHYGRVARREGSGWRIDRLPSVRFVQLLPHDAIRNQLRAAGVRAEVRLADLHFAVPRHDDWVELQLWTKRFLADIGYTYKHDRRDCNAYSRTQRVAADLLGHTGLEGAPTVGGIYAHMDAPFAGISDGYHALNLSRTDAGGWVSEPQGIDLIYQRLEPWARSRRITEVFND